MREYTHIFRKCINSGRHIKAEPAMAHHCGQVLELKIVSEGLTISFGSLPQRHPHLLQSRVLRLRNRRTMEEGPRQAVVVPPRGTETRQ